MVGEAVWSCLSTATPVLPSYETSFLPSAQGVQGGKGHVNNNASEHGWTACPGKVLQRILCCYLCLMLYFSLSTS